MDFKDFVAKALEKKPQLLELLAREFQVANSTVLRWATGAAVPHPKTQETIRRYIIEHS